MTCGSRGRTKPLIRHSSLHPPPILTMARGSAASTCETVLWTEVLTLPGMRVFHDHLAVDEAGGIMYIAVNGDLLRMPLPSKSK